MFYNLLLRVEIEVNVNYLRVLECGSGPVGVIFFFVRQRVYVFLAMNVFFAINGSESLLRLASAIPCNVSRTERQGPNFMKKNPRKNKNPTNFWIFIKKKKKKKPETFEVDRQHWHHHQ